MQSGLSNDYCLQIFHLEDSLPDADILRRSLKDIPCSILQIFTEESFEAALNGGNVDLIISDSGIPSFDTFGALSLARRTKPQLPFIFFSDNDSPRLKEKALAEGATAFISKRNLPELIQAVRDLSRKTRSEV
jgi:phosphoserine phosphatase RsbU/P